MMIRFFLIVLFFTTCLQASGKITQNFVPSDVYDIKSSGLITPHSVLEDDDNFAYKKSSFVSLKLLQQQKKTAQQKMNFYTGNHLLLEQKLKSAAYRPVKSISVDHYALRETNNPYASYVHDFDDKAKIALMKANPSSLFGLTPLSESQMQSCYVGHKKLVKASKAVDEKQKLLDLLQHGTTQQQWEIFGNLKADGKTNIPVYSSSTKFLGSLEVCMSVPSDIHNPIALQEYLLQQAKIDGMLLQKALKMSDISKAEKDIKDNLFHYDLHVSDFIGLQKTERAIAGGIIGRSVNSWFDKKQDQKISFQENQAMALEEVSTRGVLEFEKQQKIQQEDQLRREKIQLDRAAREAFKKEEKRKEKREITLMGEQEVATRAVVKYEQEKLQELALQTKKVQSSKSKAKSKKTQVQDSELSYLDDVIAENKKNVAGTQVIQSHTAQIAKKGSSKKTDHVVDSSIIQTQVNDIITRYYQFLHDVSNDSKLQEDLDEKLTSLEQGIVPLQTKLLQAGESISDYISIETYRSIKYLYDHMNQGTKGCTIDQVTQIFTQQNHAIKSLDDEIDRLSNELEEIQKTEKKETAIVISHQELINEKEAIREGLHQRVLLYTKLLEKKTVHSRTEVFHAMGGCLSPLHKISQYHKTPLLFSAFQFEKHMKPIEDQVKKFSLATMLGEAEFKKCDQQTEDLLRKFFKKIPLTHSDCHMLPRSFLVTARIVSFTFANKLLNPKSIAPDLFDNLSSDLDTPRMYTPSQIKVLADTQDRLIKIYPQQPI